MPMIIEYIDKIARDKKRTVLYIAFDMDLYPEYDFENYDERNKLIKWLKANDIEYQECGDIASETGWEAYRGQLYIDVPMDEKDPKYQLLCEHLEYDDGSFKIEGVMFYYLPLEMAMKNAHHDEPGFWKRWAEEF
jgi:hypothetical protein